MQEIRIGENTMEVVMSFGYFGNVCEQSGWLFDAITGRTRSAWKAFCEPFPILTNRPQETFVLINTSWKWLEVVFRLRLHKTSPRHLQGVLIKTNIFVLVMRLQDLQNIFKTFSKRLQNVLLRCLQDVFRTSSRRFQDIFKTSCKNFLKKSWRRLQNVLQRFLQDIFKKFSRRLQDFFMTSLKCIIINTSSTPLWDVFNTFLRRTSKTIINKKIYLDHTYDKFMVRVQSFREWTLWLYREFKKSFF